MNRARKRAPIKYDIRSTWKEEYEEEQEQEANRQESEQQASILLFCLVAVFDSSTTTAAAQRNVKTFASKVEKQLEGTTLLVNRIGTQPSWDFFRPLTGA